MNAMGHASICVRLRDLRWLYLARDSVGLERKDSHGRDLKKGPGRPGWRLLTGETCSPILHIYHEYEIGICGTASSGPWETPSQARFSQSHAHQAPWEIEPPDQGEVSS